MTALPPPVTGAMVWTGICLVAWAILDSLNRETVVLTPASHCSWVYGISVCSGSACGVWNRDTSVCGFSDCGIWNCSDSGHGVWGHDDLGHGRGQLAGSGILVGSLL